MFQILVNETACDVTWTSLHFSSLFYCAPYHLAREQKLKCSTIIMAMIHMFLNMKLEVTQPSEIRRSSPKSKIGGWHGLTSTLSTILKNKDRIQSPVLCDGRLLVMRQKIMHNIREGKFWIHAPQVVLSWNISCLTGSWINYQGKGHPLNSTLSRLRIFCAPEVALLFQSMKKHKNSQSVRALEPAHDKHTYVTVCLILTSLCIVDE
jgi:hypothetical protein